MIMLNQDHDPLVSIILVAFGGRDDTFACIDSILESDYKKYRIILVDNDSPDDTSIKVAEKFPNVTIIKSSINLGFAGGNNLGIRKAIEEKSDYVFLLNNDTVIASDTISELIRAF